MYLRMLWKQRTAVSGLQLALQLGGWRSLGQTAEERALPWL